MEGIVFIESPDCFEEQAWILPSFKGEGKTPPAWRKKKTTKRALAGPSASTPVVLRWSLALSLQLSQIPAVKWCSVTGFSMLGLNAAITPTLSCFVSSLTPVIKDMRVLPFSAQEQRKSIDPHLEWKRQHIYNLPLPRWVLKQQLAILESKKRLGLVEQMKQGTLDCCLLADWVHWLTESSNMQETDCQCRGITSWKWSRCSHSQQPPLEAQIWERNLEAESFIKP